MREGRKMSEKTVTVEKLGKKYKYRICTENNGIRIFRVAGNGRLVFLAKMETMAEVESFIKD